jgi:hypothetical protein
MMLIHLVTFIEQDVFSKIDENVIIKIYVSFRKQDQANNIVTIFMKISNYQNGV